MICFRDMTFCSRWEHCADSKNCPRSYTPEVQAAAKAWWGKDGVPIAFSTFTSCFVPMENDDETVASNDGGTVLPTKYT